MLWRGLQVRVLRHKKKLRVHNPITKSILDGVQLASRAPTSVQRLTKRSFKDIVAKFEHFVAELLQMWLVENPDLISEKALNVATLLASKTLLEAQTAAKREAVESSVADKMYGRPDKWFNYLKSKLGAEFDADDKGLFIEMKARRDVLEHSNGIVEATYLEKAEDFAKYRLGDQVRLSGQDVDEAYQLVSRLIRNIAESVVAKLKRS